MNESETEPPKPRNLAPPSRKKERPFQFSLMTLMLWTTIASIFFALVGWLENYFVCIAVVLTSHIVIGLLVLRMVFYPLITSDTPQTVSRRMYYGLLLSTLTFYVFASAYYVYQNSYLNPFLDLSDKIHLSLMRVVWIFGSSLGALMLGLYLPFLLIVPLKCVAGIVDWIVEPYNNKTRITWIFTGICMFVLGWCVGAVFTIKDSNLTPLEACYSLIPAFLAAALGPFMLILAYGTAPFPEKRVKRTLKDSVQNAESELPSEGVE